MARGTSYLGIFHQTQFGVGNVQLVAFAGLDAAHVEIEMHRTRRRPQIVVRVFGHVTCNRQTWAKSISGFLINSILIG